MANKIELLSVLGNAFEFLKQIFQSIQDTSGSTELAERMKPESEITADFTSVLLGTSIVLPTYLMEEIRESDGQRFTCIYAGTYLVAIRSGWSSEGDNGGTWIRIGDEVSYKLDGDLVDFEVTRIDSPDECQNPKVYGRAGDSNIDDIAVGFEEVFPYACPGPRYFQTWVSHTLYPRLGPR